MRILGIDPGTQKTGWGLVTSQGMKLAHVASGTITAGSSKTPLEKRLLIIHQGLQEAIATHKPNFVAVEDLFMAKYANAALKLGQARGVALLAAAQANLEVTAYAPALVKRSIVGGGRADKKQVARIVGVILNLRELPGPDASDALAVAITHAQALRMRRSPRSFKSK